MALAQLNAWRHDGSPFILCAPGASLTATLAGHGYAVESYPDASHLAAQVAEDHCPYSQTPWPGAQPYPHGMAIDVFGPDLPALGARIVADKNAGVPGTECIKYINWTDAGGRCWHDKWQPNHVQTSSTDKGHIHISFRTDYVNNPTSYDPLAQPEDDMPAIVHCTENGGYYSYPVPKWFKTEAAVDAALKAYGMTRAQVAEFGTLNAIRDALGPIPDIDVPTDEHGNVVAASGGPVLPHTHDIPAGETGPAAS